MKRRAFFGASLGAGAAAAGLSCSGEQGGRTAAPPESTVTDNGTLAGKTLQELREEHRFWLFDDYLPFYHEHVVDHEYGGFKCNTDRDGTNLNANKRTWYEGRGIWVHSYLNNKVKQDPEYVDIARCGRLLAPDLGRLSDRRNLYLYRLPLLLLDHHHLAEPELHGIPLRSG